MVPTNLPTGWTAGTQDGNSITLNAAEAGAVSIDSVIGAIQLQTNDPGSLETVGVQVVSDQMNTSTLVDIYSAVGKDQAFLNNIVAEAAQTEDNWDKWANGNKAEATGAFLSYQMTGTFGLTPDGKTLFFQIGHFSNYDLTTYPDPASLEPATVPGQTVDVFRLTQNDNGDVDIQLILENVAVGDKPAVFRTLQPLGQRYLMLSGIFGNDVWEPSRLYLLTMADDGSVTNISQPINDLGTGGTTGSNLNLTAAPASNSEDSCLWIRNATDAQVTANTAGYNNIYHRKGGQILGPFPFYYLNTDVDVQRQTWAIFPLGGYKYVSFSTQAGGFGQTASAIYLAIIDGSGDGDPSVTTKVITRDVSILTVSANEPLNMFLSPIKGPTGLDDAASVLTVTAGKLMLRGVDEPDSIYSVDYNAAAPALTTLYTTFNPALAGSQSIVSMPTYGDNDTFLITLNNTPLGVRPSSSVGVFGKNGTTATTLDKLNDDAALPPSLRDATLYGGGGNGAVDAETSGFLLTSDGIAVYTSESIARTREIVIRSGPVPEPTGTKAPPSSSGDWDFNKASLTSTIVAAVLGVALIAVLVVLLMKKSK